MSKISNELVAELLYNAAWASVEDEPPVQWCDLTDERQLTGYRGQAAAFIALLRVGGHEITEVGD